MFQFFKKKPQKRNSKPRKPQTLDDALEKALIKKAATDPDWAYRAALKKHGLEDNEGSDLDKARNMILAEELKTNPEFREQVKNEYLASMNPSGNGEVDFFEAQVQNSVLEKLQSNPELLNKVVNKRIDSMVNDSADGGSPLKDLRRYMEDLEELDEIRGGRGKDDKGESWSSAVGSVLKNVLDTDGGKMIVAKLLHTQMPQEMDGQQSPAERMVVVQVDGRPVQMPESQYQQLLGQGRMKPVGVMTPPTPPQITAPVQPPVTQSTVVRAEPSTQSVKPSEMAPRPVKQAPADEPEEEREVNGTSNNDPEHDGAVYAGDAPDENTPVGDMSSIVKMALDKLSGTPQEFADFLADEVNKETPYAETIWETLLAANAQFVIRTIEPYKDNPVYGTYVQKFLTPEGKTWIAETLHIIRLKEKQRTDEEMKVDVEEETPNGK